MAMNIADWEEKYRSGERGSESAPTALLVEAAQDLEPGTAMDLACGTGRNALYLARLGWTVTAVDGSEKAIEMLGSRAAEGNLRIKTVAADLTDPAFEIPPDTFDLVLIAYYLQRDLFPKAKGAVRPGGLLAAIAHIPERDEDWNEKRAAPGELRSTFEDWEILWSYEGPSRDPAHRRPVAEIVARRSQ